MLFSPVLIFGRWNIIDSIVDIEVYRFLKVQNSRCEKLVL